MRNLRADERISIALREMYQMHGYLPYKVNRFEEYDLYMRNKRFLMSEHVLAFSDMDGKLMALKPDVTLSIIKNAADSADTKKVCYAESVYRVPRGERRFKEIMQTGLEVIGAVDDYTVSEVLILAAKSLEAIRADYALDVSDLSIVSAIMEAGGLAADAQGKLLACIGDKNLHGLRALCASLGVDAQTAMRLEMLVTVYGPLGKTLALLEQADLPEACGAALGRLAAVLKMTEAAGVGNINLDFSVTSDMNYYNGIVFTGFVSGVPASVLSGGQYDRLMEKMGRKNQAMGFAVYLDQLGREQAQETDVDLLITYTDTSDPAAVQREAQAARRAGQSVRVQRAGETAVRAARVLEL